MPVAEKSTMGARRIDGKMPTDMEIFDSVFPQILDELSQLNLTGVDDCHDWFHKVLEYNVPHGKKNRGVATMETYKLLVGKPSDESLRLACILGWCTEILQAYFLVADDIMDQSETRRGRKCWYKNSEVGLIAINDALFLENCIYQVLKTHFRNMPCYVPLIELFHEADYVTIHGQCLDMLSSCEGKPDDVPCDVSMYTFQRYHAVVTNKTAYYSFYLPVALALHLAGISDEATHKTAKDILIELGYFFQVQDDYLDCYGDPAVTGKIGTDIQDGKCSWLVCTALTLCDDSQRNVLVEHYGKQSPASVEAVRDVYKSLDVASLYKTFEETSYTKIQTMIEAYPDATRLPRHVFYGFAKKIYKRDK